MTYDAYGDVTPEVDAAGDPLPLSHLSKETRLWLYRVAAAGVPVAGIWATQIDGVASLILGLVAAVLGLSAGAAAATNTVALPKP